MSGVSAQVDWVRMLYFFITMFGVMSMYVFSLMKGFEGAATFLRRMIPDHQQVFYDRLDFVVVVIAGSIIGYLLLARFAVGGARGGIRMGWSDQRADEP